MCGEFDCCLICDHVIGGALLWVVSVFRHVGVGFWLFSKYYSQCLIVGCFVGTGGCRSDCTKARHGV